MRRTRSAASLLRLWDIVDDTIVTTEGCYFRGYALNGLDSEHLPSDVLLQASNLLYQDARRELDAQTLIQFVLEGHTRYGDIFSAFDAVPPSENPVLNHQRRERLNFLQSGGLRRFSSYAFVGSRVGFSNKEFMQLSAASHRARLDDVAARAKKLRDVFTRAGLDGESLSEAKLSELTYRWLNPALSADLQGTDAFEAKAQRGSSFGAVSRRDVLLQEPIYYADSHLRIGAKYFKVLSLKLLPPSTRFTLMEVFLHLPIDFRLCVTTLIPDQETASASFRVARRVAHADAHRNEHVQDSERQAKVKESDRLSELLADTGQALLCIGMQLVLSGNSLEQLEQRVVETQAYLKRYQLLFVEETGRHDWEFFKTLPGMATSFDRYKLVTSNNAVDLWPIFGGCHGDRRPVLLVKTARQELFSYDPVEPNRDNWNATVFGASGAGKSVFMNMLITTAMLSNHTRGRLMVVDFAGETKSSYLMVARLFGGQFVPVLSRKQDIAINPFPPLDEALDEAGEINGDALNFLLVLTDMLLANTGEDKDTQLHRTLLQRGIQETYRRLASAGATPTYVDLFETLRQMEQTKNVDQLRLGTLLRLLDGFLNAPEARLFTRPSTISPSSDFLIFDLFGIDTLSSAMQSALTFVVCSYVKRLAFSTRDARTKYVVMDEVAQLLRRKEMAALVHELYSTARKHGTSIWTVTQKYSDYVASAVAGTINLNSTTQVFLSHARAAEARRQIAHDFDLNAREQHLFETLVTRKGHYSEALMRTEIFDPSRNEKRAIAAKLRIDLSAFDYEISTSDAADRARQQRAIERYPDRPLVAVLDRLARARAKGLSAAAPRDLEDGAIS